MSTSKIGRTINPRTKVTPSYGNTELQEKEEQNLVINKLEDVSKLLTSQLTDITEIIKSQQKQIDFLKQNILQLDKKLNEILLKLETIPNSTQQKIKEDLQDLRAELDNTTKEVDNVEKKKGWFG